MNINEVDIKKWISHLAKRDKSYESGKLGLTVCFWETNKQKKNLIAMDWSPLYVGHMAYDVYLYPWVNDILRVWGPWLLYLTVYTS